MDSSFGEMRINDRIKSMLAEIAKWAKLLAIVGFIGIGLMVIIGLFAGTMMASLSSLGGDAGPAMGMGGGFITFIYLLIAALYFFPILYLYQFATGAQRALASGSESEIEGAFESLRKHYRFLGILMIVMLSLYALSIIGGLAAMAALGGG